LRAVDFRDVVFVLSDDLPVHEVCSIMQQHPGLLHYKMFYRGSNSMVGSDSTERSGEVFSASSHYNLAKPSYKRSKRIFDFFSCVMILILFPVLAIFQPSISLFFRHTFSVLIGRKTWIGYTDLPNGLPGIKPGILSANGVRISTMKAARKSLMKIIDQRYAADYEWTFDMELLLKHFRQVSMP
jgi:O-antigen biosynthesis protein